ncbi:MAG: hypothetical protein FJ271_15690 [Planctomycetes bacterium]|nr:hypothetical protein [Planctomycetota bacterium]
MNEFFVNSFQKVATFRKNGDNKQGGNVASYFCTPKGQVVHAIAGPVDAATFLREARWTVELWKLAQLEGNDKATRLAAFMRKAHLDRLRQDFPGTHAQRTPGFAVQALIAPGRGNQLIQNLDNQAKVHLLLGNYPLPKVQQIYSLVFERILNERLSTVPVVQK